MLLVVGVIWSGGVSFGQKQTPTAPTDDLVFVSWFRWFMEILKSPTGEVLSVFVTPSNLFFFFFLIKEGKRREGEERRK